MCVGGEIAGVRVQYFVIKIVEEQNSDKRLYKNYERRQQHTNKRE